MVDPAKFKLMIAVIFVVLRSVLSANQLNSYFTNSANRPAHCCDPPSLHQVESVFHFQHFGEDEVLTALKRLNVHKQLEWTESQLAFYGWLLRP